jgi:hypothetical protein
MNRFLTLLVLGMGVLIVVPGLAKKKPAKPIIEILEATVPGGEVLRFEIEESSTDEDIQELAKAYAKSGKDGVESALGKIDKGRYLVRHNSYPIRIVQSESLVGTRTVYITSDAADQVVGELGGRVSIGHRGYPLAFTQLRIDEQGKGVGQQVPFAAITFNKQGIIDVRSMQVGTGVGSVIRLTNVHALVQ